MREEQRFAAALEGLTALAKEQGNVLSEDQIRETFPDYLVYRAFTSGIILKKLERENGLVFDNVRQAMERMKRDGVTEVIVQPTYIINGVEYDWMRA